MLDDKEKLVLVILLAIDILLILTDTASSSAIFGVGEPY